MQQLITVSLWLSGHHHTLLDYTISGIKDQLLLILEQLESCNSDNDSYEIIIKPKLGIFDSIYKGNNRTETITLIKQLLE